MKLRNTVIVVAAVAMAAMLQTAQAGFVSLGTGAGNSVTLADLEATGPNGDTYGLSIGDKVFSDFTSLPINLDAPTGQAADIYVAVTHSGSSYYLTWSGDIAHVTGGNGVGDLTLTYTVTAIDGLIYAIDQNYTGTSGANPGTSLSVAETAAVNGNTAASSVLNATITSTSYSAIGAILNPDSAVVNVTKDISLDAGSDPNNFLDISVVQQSFDQIAVPEPTTVLAGALLLLPLGASTLRILRRNRIA